MQTGKAVPHSSQLDRDEWAAGWARVLAVYSDSMKTIDIGLERTGAQHYAKVYAYVPTTERIPES